MLVQNSTVVFNVRRNEPELVPPALPTPMDLKPLSDADDLHRLRLQQSVILVYEATIDRKDVGKDPAKVIRAALAEALVYYYTWAGRLREGPSGRLMVDCTAEGVVPPFPCTEQLLYNRTSNMLAVVGCPMFTIQIII